MLQNTAHVHSGLLDCFRDVQHSRVSRTLPGCAEYQTRAALTNTYQNVSRLQMPFNKHVYDRDVMGKPTSFAMDSCFGNCT